ncbi:MAG: metal-dependent hydrolase [Gammaproteobacteria bacterium]|nr:metal-dependent hydrolase [Gammaproteobacteria bacterium]
MDPLTQGALGASMSQSISKKSQVLIAGLLGFLSGMSPDLDVLIRSESDPLLFLEFHRQFTHSLIFIPVGGLICASIFYFIFSCRVKLSFKHTYIYCTLGYATHGLLDSCTSYGTQLLWPFTNHRFSWDTVSIIDPILTLPLLILIIIAAIRKNPKFAFAGLIWMVCYQCIGLYQNHRASEIGWQLAKQRGHSPIRLEAKPTLGNLILWKVIYEIDEGYYTDGVRIGLKNKVFPGELTPKLDVPIDFPWLDNDSQQAEDLKRFTWFSQGYVSVDPNNPLRVIDTRYSLLPNKASGLWSIWITQDALPNQHAVYRMDRDIDPDSKKLFFDMLFDR